MFPNSLDMLCGISAWVETDTIYAINMGLLNLPILYWKNSLEYGFETPHAALYYQDIFRKKMSDRKKQNSGRLNFLNGNSSYTAHLEENWQD